MIALMLFVSAFVFLLAWAQLQYAPGIGMIEKDSNLGLFNFEENWVFLVSIAATVLCVLLLPSHWGPIMWGIASMIAILSMRSFWQFEPALHTESPHVLHNRLRALQHQLDRLKEKEQLDTALTKTNLSQHALRQFSDRFELILLTIENHLLMGDHEKAEKIITLFARHLRQVLYEGATPFLPLHETIVHIQTHLALMQLLTGNRFRCEVDDGMLDDFTLKRYTQPLLISAWVQEALWPYFNLAERSLEDIGATNLQFEQVNESLVASFSAPNSMYLPEGSAEQMSSQTFRLLGDSSAWPKSMEAQIIDAISQ